MQRHLSLSRSARLSALIATALGATFFASADAQAQVSGAAAKPLPDVLLLVDTSGSMELNVDGSAMAPGACSADQTTPVYTDPNRWGILVQALTGNIQPFYNCLNVDRKSGSDFATRYSINGKKPYDTDYIFPYHQPVAGGLAPCVTEPWYLPGAATGQGVGIGLWGDGTSNATNYPDNALANVLVSSLLPVGAGHYAKGITDSVTTGIPSTYSCSFTQGNDGQLDVTKYYARFALMTFDSDTNGQTGIGTPPTNTDPTVNGINTSDPFTGQWSYLRSSGNPDRSSPMTNSANGAAQGRPGTTPACTMSDQEVGARNAGAPPWEGRLIDFPSADATIYEMDTQNSHIQQTLIATRPQGATPLDGMMDDARDFYWYKSPNGPVNDPYTCRERYIIILTDGAPNLNLQPSCTKTNGQCPYDVSGASDIAHTMFIAGANTPQHVTTFVVGFAVSAATDTAGDGFPAGGFHHDCKSWLNSQTGGTLPAKSASLYGTCGSMRSAGTLTSGSTADACCQLNDIAYQGSGGANGAYFAESEADIVLSFGQILADIIHNASTKTTPVFSPAVAFNAAAFANSGASTASAGEFYASYIPSAQRPWSGEIDRTRFLCDGTNHSIAQPEVDTKGDFESENLAVQSSTKTRFFFTVVGDNTSNQIDSLASIRPFADLGGSSTGGDAVGIPSTGGAQYKGREVNMNGMNLHFVSPSTDWPLALNVTKNTCQRGRAVNSTSLTDIIPALDDPSTGPPNCSDVVWGFLTADPDPIPFTGDPASAGSYNFNVRCSSFVSPTDGICSITGGSCTPGPAATCPTGETCVPKCSALGAIYHSTPAVIPPPQSLLREDGFRNYQQNRANRQSVLYAASTDGILHAFNALEQDGTTGNNEIWAFVPPAVLPQLSSNYPQGNQILLDGAPVVRETVWDRASGVTGNAKDWHSTLVAGLGTFGGYYAVNVTDADCGGTGHCGSGATPYESPAEGTVADVNTSGDTTTGKKGPHFLWQLTDVPWNNTSETLPVHRNSTLGASGTTPGAKMVSLFGKNTSTPAVGMVDIKDSGGVDHQVGIAILPGGYENPPITTNGVVQSCPRKAKSAAEVYADPALNYRANVRRWAAPDCNAAVPGRGVTIVRLDNGEIIKHFGRKTQDVPLAITGAVGVNSVIDTAFDSPMVGTPVVFPDQVGVPIQEVFIGDADGTLWRIDLTSSDPSLWHANLFADLIAPQGTAAAASSSMPIQVAPVLSTDDTGALIVNVATGDQESIVVSSDINYLFSIKEGRDTSTPPRPRAITNWYKAFSASERVTGPMVVFDKVLYFASYLPQHPSAGSCASLGNAYLWGLDYVVPKTSGTLSSGGASKWCTAVDSVTGLCTSGVYNDNEPEGNDLIPGVSLQSAQACVVDSTDEYGNTAFSTLTNTTYSLSFGIAKPNTTGSHPPQSDRGQKARPLPLTQTRIDSWSIVVN